MLRVDQSLWEGADPLDESRARELPGGLPQRYLIHHSSQALPYEVELGVELGVALYEPAEMLTRGATVVSELFCSVEYLMEQPC